MAYEGFTAEELDAMPDRVATAFSGHTLLVTGGTGFMGKVLVEKVLRKCDDITQIYLLIRKKKGKSPKQRLEEMFANPIFDQVKALRGGLEPLLEKVTVIPGDMEAPDLAISPEDRQMLIENVTLIGHAAATIRFDAELKRAVLLNVRGTKLILELARECKKLKLLGHISTAYCHLHEKLLEEKPYPPPADPYQVIQAIEWMDNRTINSVTHKLLGNIPNTYAFTKALGEALVIEAIEKHNLPAIVMRPSIVIPIWQEPIQGWTDNIHGPTGLLIGAGKGVIRSMYCKKNSYADFVPVDVVVNALFIGVWYILEYGDKDVKVINCTSSAEIKVTWQEIIDVGRDIAINTVPLNGVAWYPGGSIKDSKLYHNICVLFFHWIPAIIVDTLLFCLGYEPVLINVQRHIQKGIEVVEYYTTNQWDFKSDLAQTVRKLLNARERRDYKCDTVGLDFRKYFESCVRAARIYILKESDDTLPAARRHMTVMKWVDTFTKIIFWGLILYLFRGWFSYFLSFFVKFDESPAAVQMEA